MRQFRWSTRERRVSQWALQDETLVGAETGRAKETRPSPLQARAVIDPAPDTVAEAMDFSAASEIAGSAVDVCVESRVQEVLGVTDTSATEMSFWARC